MSRSIKIKVKTDWKVIKEFFEVLWEHMRQKRAYLLLLLFLVAIDLASLKMYKELVDQRKANAGMYDSAENLPTPDLIKRVGQIVILPTNEEPVIATVNDVEKLKDQPFFANAAMGDKVLIYSGAKMVVLYRPENNKVVVSAPLSDTTSTQ